MVVVAHAPTPTTATTAIEVGVDGLAHAVVATDPVARADVVDLLRQRDVFVVTTLSAMASTFGMPVAEPLVTSSIGARIGPRWRDYLRRLAGPAPRWAQWDAVLAFVSEASECGVRLLAGTDAAFPGVVPGAALHCELELLTRCGLDTTAALRAATSTPAEVFDLGARGVIRSGGVADIVVVHADPSAAVTATRDLASVIVGGALFCG
jgi:imidazolonepropionase-like amidohydrolase